MQSIPRVRGRLPRLVTPVAYELVLQVDPRKERFSGEVTIHLDVHFETAQVNLHARDLRIGRVEVRTPEGEVRPARVAPAEGEGAEPEAGEIVVDTGRLLGRGPCELYLEFEGPFGQLAGLYLAKDEGSTYAITQFEAADARRCFPCFDEPGYKVPFQVTLMVPEGDEAFANTPEVERDTQHGYTHVRFAETKPLPTYLVAFAVGPFEVIRSEASSSVPIRLLVPKGKRAQAGTALAFAPGLLSVLEAWFGRPYPYEKLDLVAVPDFAAGAMENAGLVTFREEYLLADPEHLTRQRRRRIAEVMAHEIAHHWFGNLVTMHWWDDLWLNEAFATWMAAKCVDLWDARFDQVTDVLQTRTRVMSTDSLPAARKVRQEVGSVGEAEQAFDGLTYYKGAAVLGMLEKWVGEEAFQAGVRAYIDHHAWGNASAADLFSHLDQASGRDVTGVARTFLEQPGVPLVSIVDGQVRQEPFSLLGLDPPCEKDALWSVPIKVEGAPWQLLETREASQPGAGHPNEGEWSYYRWALPEAELVALSARAGELDVRSRLGLMDNAWAMVASGRLGPQVYLEVLRALREQTARPLVEELVSGADRLEDVWEELTGREAWTRAVRALLSGQLARVGLDPRDGEHDDDTIVRPQVFRALGLLGRDPEVIAAAEARAHLTLADPRAVPAEMAAASLALAAHEGRIAFEELAALLARADDPEQRIAALRALGMLPAGEALGRALALTLSDRVRAQDFYYVFRQALARPETRAQTFGWFKEHFEAIRQRQPEFTFVHIGTIIGHFRTEAGRDDARAFLEDRHVPGGERAIRQGVEQANHLIALREAGREAILGSLEGGA